MAGRALALSYAGAVAWAAVAFRAVRATQSDIADSETGRASARAGLGLHHLRYVLAAAEQGGFRRAARRLGVQQSAVSRRIQELEVRLGAPIFERGPHGVRLTGVGEDFVRGAQGAVAGLDEVVLRAGDAARDDRLVLRVGLLAGLGGGKPQDLLGALVASDPGVLFDLVEADVESLGLDLARGRLDLAFLSSGGGGLARAAAWRERLLLATPADAPIAAEMAVSWSALKGVRLLTAAAIFNDVAALADRRLGRGAGRAIALAPTPAGVARRVALGQGLGVVNESDAARVTGVLYRPLARSFLAFDAVLGRRPRKPIVDRLLSLLPGV